jgi:hypothetical protein
MTNQELDLFTGEIVTGEIVHPNLITEREGTAGLWELAVICWDGDGIEDYGLTYETPITDDVLGWLEDEAVGELLTAIAALPVRGVAS